MGETDTVMTARLQWAELVYNHGYGESWTVIVMVGLPTSLLPQSCHIRFRTAPLVLFYPSDDPPIDCLLNGPE